MKKKHLASVAAAALAAALLVPGLAFASPTDPDTATTFTDTELAALNTSAAKGAATRAAMPSLEILGINSVEESGQFVTMVNNIPQYDWEKPKYYFAASKFNSSPSPYLVRLALGLSGGAAYNPSREGAGNGPDAALAEYGVDPTDDAVWDLDPDVIVGNNNNTVLYQYDYGSHDYTYEPGVHYGASNFNALITTMGDIATTSNLSNKTGRYGNPATIAAAYGNYINGTIGYVQSQVSSANYKTIVLITGVSGTDGNHTYTIAKTTYNQDGTAAQNRYLEAVDAVTNNYANVYDVLSLTTAQLKRSDLVDVILVGGQQGGNIGTITDALEADGLLYKSYFVEDNGSQGSMYGVIMNAPDNAQNVGRILGFIYPSVIDQSQFVGYFYEQFYHINTDDVAQVMAAAMDGVRNADLQNYVVVDTVTENGVTYEIRTDAASNDTIAEATAWTSAQCAYDSTISAAVAAKIAAGLAYLAS